MKDLTFSYLYYFSVVAEEENVTRAAKRLYVSQPALSATIVRLEKALGFPLFERQSNRITLNDAGKCFLQYVNSAFSAINEGRSKAHQIANQSDGSIRIVSTMGILRYVCDSYLKDYPLCKLQLTVCDTEELISDMTSSQADIGVNFGLVQDSRLISRVLMEGPYCLAVNLEHPLASRASVNIRELSECQLFCSNLAHTNEKIRSLFVRAGCKCKLLNLDEKEVLFQAVEFGLGGVICLPMLTEVRNASGKVVFIPITGCAESACATLIWNRGLYRSAEMERLIHYIRTYFHNNEKILMHELDTRDFAFTRSYLQRL